MFSSHGNKFLQHKFVAVISQKQMTTSLVVCFCDNCLFSWKLVWLITHGLRRLLNAAVLYICMIACTDYSDNFEFYNRPLLFKFRWFFVWIWQVVDISSMSPEKVVRWLPPRCRLVVAGGDGTVAWVLNSLLSNPQVKVSVKLHLVISLLIYILMSISHTTKLIHFTVTVGTCMIVSLSKN